MVPIRGDSKPTDGIIGPSITLYTSQTPNGVKISILLEELDLSYHVQRIDMRIHEQKEDWFTNINPNGKIPAITDRLKDGSEVRVFESGSIMQYLVDRYDEEHKISYPRGTKEYIETQSWLFWQMGGIGPMQGQANHFNRYAPEKIPYAADRYLTETNRLYGVLEKHLVSTKSPYIVGDKCTVADISIWGWVSLAGWAGIDIDDFPTIKAWDARMLARPGVEKGRHCPDNDLRDLLADKEKLAYLQQAGKEVNAARAQKDREAVAAYKIAAAAGKI